MGNEISPPLLIGPEGPMSALEFRADPPIGVKNVSKKTLRSVKAFAIARILPGDEYLIALPHTQVGTSPVDIQPDAEETFQFSERREPRNNSCYMNFNNLTPEEFESESIFVKNGYLLFWPQICSRKIRQISSRLRC